MWWPRFFKSKQQNEDNLTPAYILPVVEFDRSQITPAILDDIRSTIADMNEIPSQFRSSVYTAAVEMVRRGGNQHYFCQEISALRINSLDHHSIAEISRFLWFRSKSLLDIRRMISLGIIECEWLYSNSPCGNDRNLDAEHRSANHKRFKILDGLVVKGKASWPGLERGCKCTSRPIIKGFS